MSDKDEAPKQPTAKIPKMTPPAGVPTTRPTPPKPPPARTETTQIRASASITPPAGTPKPVANVRPVEKSVDEAFDDSFDQPTVPPNRQNWVEHADEKTDTRAVPHETMSDLGSMRARFEQDMRAPLTRLVDVMLEIRFGQPLRVHVEPARLALAALLAGSGSLAAIHVPLERLLETVDAALAGKPQLGDRRDDLLRHFSGLAQQLPSLDLEAARTGRERVIVEALLWQIDGIEQPAIAGLTAAAADRLDVLATTPADELASTVNLRPELAAAIVDKFTAYRAQDTLLSNPDATTERKRLAEAVAALRKVCDELSTAAAAWTDAARRDKRALRRPRALAYQRVRLVLARMGELEVIRTLDRKSFADRLAALATVK